MKLTEHIPAHMAKVDRSGGITPSHEDAPVDAALALDDGFLPHVAARTALRAVGGGAAPGDVHPDLTAEREAATFDARSLTYVLYGGKRATERRERIAALIEGDGVFDNAENMFVERAERYQRALAKSVRLREPSAIASFGRVLFYFISDSPYKI